MHEEPNFLGTLLNCVVTRTAKGATLTGATAINCTFDDNDGNLCSEKSVLKDCICLRSNNTEGYSVDDRYRNGTFTRCVINISRNFKGALTLDGPDNAVNVPFLQCVAPLFDDWRLLASSDALGRGAAADLAAVTLPVGLDAFVDFSGNPIAKTGAIAAGAVQQAIVPAGGAMVFTEPVKDVATGRSGINPYGYAFAAEYPAQWHVAPVLAAGQRLYGFKIPGATGGGRFPEMDETLWTMPPPAGQVVTNQVILTTAVLHVDPTTGSDEGEGRGTEAAPYETLQAAVNAAGAKSYTVIEAAAGTYAKGSTTALLLASRVVVSKSVRIKGAGAGLSVIKGELCTDTSGDYYEDGRGATAMRCIAFGDYTCFCAIQGFTLTEGRTAYKSGNDDWDTRGAGVACAGHESVLDSAAFVTDCVISNCVAARGSTTYQGNLFRCRLQAFRGQQRYAKVHSCLFLPTDNQMSEIVGGGNRLYQCTAIGTASFGPFSNNSVPSLNTIGCKGTALDRVRCQSFAGCLVWDFTSYANYGSYTKADPLFVDAANGDYNVYSDSEAVECTVFDDDSWKSYSSDIASRPLVFVKGRPLAGAFQAPVASGRGVVVVSQNSAKGNVSPTGRQELPDGSEVTVTASDTTRHLIGFLLDGQYVAGSTCTVTARSWQAGVPTGKTTLEAIYSTNWYVNANADAAKGVVGDDANDGFTAETPKRTLANAVAIAGLEAGDVIHAAPGVYEEGQMAVEAAWTSSDSTTPVRVVVREGITLVGDAGAEQTVIRGHLEATSATAAFGKNPVRCANVANGGRLDGFTLTGGSSAWVSSSGESVPYTCGAVIAPKPVSSKLPLVSNCIISNNWACRGGVSYGGYFINCQMLENHCTESCPTFAHASLVNCLIDRNEGGTCIARFPYEMRHVTMTATNRGKDGGALTAGYILDSDAAPNAYKRGIANCIILGPQSTEGERGAMNATNCIFLTGVNYAREDLWSGCAKKTADEVALDASGRPTKGSAAIDFGDNGYVPPVAQAGDLADGQRVYNGTVDAGCFEYDWRGDYAAALGAGVTVEKATANVTLENGKVRLPNGETVAGSWPAASGKARYAVPMTATGGTLAGVLSNAEAGFAKEVAVTDGDETVRFKLANTALDFVFGFAGTGYGEIADFDQTVPGFLLILR